MPRIGNDARLSQPGHVTASAAMARSVRRSISVYSRIGCVYETLEYQTQARQRRERPSHFLPETSADSLIKWIRDGFCKTIIIMLRI